MKASTAARAAAALGAAGVACPAVARAQAPRPPAVEVTGTGVFGDELLLTSAIQTIRVDVENRTARPMSGRVRASASGWNVRGEQHVVALDVPARGRRRLLLDLFAPEGGTIELRYEVGGRALARSVISPSYAPSLSGLVILGEPPRLRGALGDIDAMQPAIGPYASPAVARMPVGVVSFDPTTGDPILPTTAAGWSRVALLVTGTAELSRVGSAEGAAIAAWLRTGGNLLVFPRSDAELSEPFLRSLAGDLEPISGEPSVAHDQLVPEARRGRYLRGGPGVLTEPFGCSRAVGFGRVHVASYDGMSPSGAEAPETALLVRSILESRTTPERAGPILSFAAGVDTMDDAYWSGGPSFGRLRAALDPNEGYRPALGLVAVVLFLYVIVVGPLNFTFVGRKNRPVLALVTTPLMALGCLALMLGVGYLGKGTRTRFNAVEILEVREGEALGVARRYTGFFLTRPGTFALELPESGTASLVQSASADNAPRFDHGADPVRMDEIRGGLWETIFVREDRLAELDGVVRFGRAGRVLTSVHNGTSRALRGAVVLDPSSGWYTVGDVPPGGSAPVSGTPGGVLDTTWYGTEVPPSVRDLARTMRLDEEDELVLHGVLRVMGGTPAGAGAPVLFAWAEGESGPERAGLFARERDLRFLRVAPVVEEQSLAVAPDRTGTEGPPVEGVLP